MKARSRVLCGLLAMMGVTACIQAGLDSRGGVSSGQRVVRSHPDVTARTVGPLDPVEAFANAPTPPNNPAWDAFTQWSLSDVRWRQDRDYLMQQLELDVVGLDEQTAFLLDRDPTHSGFALMEAINLGFRWQMRPICAQPLESLNHCFRTPAQMEIPSPATRVGVDVTATADHVVTLKFHTFSTSDDPAWKVLLQHEDVVNASALVIDLREARGTNPQTVMPWLASLTHRSALYPLRSVERFVWDERWEQEYRRRYVVRARDRGQWQALVGETENATRRVDVPMTVLMGPDSGPVSELIARVLETYADASVYGATSDTARVAWDSPAVIELEHSGLQVFAFADAYRFNTAIEAATGDTRAWRAPVDTADVEIEREAVKELRERLRTGERWPKLCDAVSTYVGRSDALPATARAKLEWDPAVLLGSADAAGVARVNERLKAPVKPAQMEGFMVTVRSRVAPSVLVRVLRSCDGLSGEVRSTSDGMREVNLSFPLVREDGERTARWAWWEAVSRLVQLDAIESVYVGAIRR